MEFELTCYEVRHIDEDDWHKISEKTVMERIAESYDPVTPVLSKILRGDEIILSHEIYRVINCK